MMLRSIRRRLCDILLGDDVVMFARQRYLDALGLGEYAGLPDSVVAAVTRRWFATIGQVEIAAAREAGKPFSVYLTQSSVLSLARYAKDVNAETAEFHISGSVDGGRTLEDYRLTLTRKAHDPADWDENAPPVEKVEEDGQITSVTFRINTSDEFERWRMERAAQAIEARSDETPKAAQPEGRKRGPKDAPKGGAA